MQQQQEAGQKNLLSLRESFIDSLNIIWTGSILVVTKQFQNLNLDRELCLTIGKPR